MRGVSKRARFMGKYKERRAGVREPDTMRASVVAGMSDAARQGELRTRRAQRAQRTRTGTGTRAALFVSPSWESKPLGQPLLEGGVKLPLSHRSCEELKS